MLLFKPDKYRTQLFFLTGSNPINSKPQQGQNGNNQGPTPTGTDTNNNNQQDTTDNTNTNQNNGVTVFQPNSQDNSGQQQNNNNADGSIGPVVPQPSSGPGQRVQSTADAYC